MKHRRWRSRDIVIGCTHLLSPFPAMGRYLVIWYHHFRRLPPPMNSLLLALIMQGCTIAALHCEWECPLWLARLYMMHIYRSWEVSLCFTETSHFVRAFYKGIRSASESEWPVNERWIRLFERLVRSCRAGKIWGNGVARVASFCFLGEVEEVFPADRVRLMEIRGMFCRTDGWRIPRETIVESFADEMGV